MDTPNDLSPMVAENPRLPPELEHVIFEEAALSRPDSIPHLMLIATRVKEWVEPLLYPVVLVSSNMKSPPVCGFPLFTPRLLLRAIAAKPPGFFEKAVKHLFLQADQLFEAEAILTACLNVTDLFASSVGVVNMPALWALRDLRRLTVNLGTFLDHHPIGCAPSAFRNITHLALLDYRVTSFDPSRLLALIPHLTHISFNRAPPGARFYAALHAEKRLHYIVLLLRDRLDRANAHQLAHDERFVCIRQPKDYCTDWLLGVHGGSDYWSLAESFIAARRVGEIDAAVYTISDTSDTRWMD
ncbi:hypothetical protein B0H19DRAFT_1265014 [Mycena capillaripes]|nr:hypothetical protein B0H19DRAFT_1265014 [Mycena capillaripes]